MSAAMVAPHPRHQCPIKPPVSVLQDDLSVFAQALLPIGLARWVSMQVLSVNFVAGLG